MSELDRRRPRPVDNAVYGPLKGGVSEPTYGGVLSFMRRRYTRDLNGVDVVVWGIPFDAAVSNRPGTRFGPQAIRRASAIFDGDPQWPFGFDPYERLTVVDYGDCVFDYGRIAEVPACIHTQAAEILATGAKLVSLGGDHSVTYPLLQAHAERHGPLALVQFDAHQDTWHDEDDRVDHGSFVGGAVRKGLIDPARSIQVGIRTVAPETCGIEILDGEAVQDLGVRGIVDRIVARVGSGPAYLTFDIDCLDPAFAPGTGTPVAGGPSSAQMLMVLRRLGAIDWVGLDVVEVSPPYDHADITAIAGATVALYGIGLLAERRR
ncbi:MAG: agmatinase [Geminicoccaceae bacterium]